MKLTALGDLNRALRENRVDEVTEQLGREPGMRAVALGSGASEWEWQPAGERVANPFGFLYGGYVAVFVDIVLSSAIGSVLAEDELATTAEFKVEFVRPAAVAPLRGQGRVLHKGSRVAFVEASILAASGELLAKASSTWTILRQRAERESRAH